LFAVRGGEEPEVSVGGGEHGADGEVELVGDAGGLVDEEEGDGREAADGGFGAGKCDDAGAVWEEEGGFVVAVAAGLDGEVFEEMGGFTEEFCGLAEAGGDGEGEGVGVEEGVVDGAGGGDGGLAPLAGAIEDDARGGGAEDGDLGGVRVEAEALAGEAHGVGMVENVGEGGHV
jgi:hypothetical protein